MLDLPNSLIVCSSLLLLMFLVAVSWGSMAVTGRMGLKTLTSKKASCRLSPKKPCALMSSLASSCLLTVRIAKVSPERGCNPGSIPTLGHTSVRSFAERSLISLCLRKLNPPRLQVRACSTVKLLPLTHFSGSQSGFQPNLRQIASLNAVLCR